MASNPTWRRVQRPLAGLALVIILGVTTYHAAATLAAGGSMPHVRGRSALIVSLAYAFAKVLGLRATFALSSAAVVIQIILIGRALRSDGRVDGGRVAPVSAPARSDVIAAFAALRRRRRVLDAVQLAAALATGALALMISFEPSVALPQRIGFLASFAGLVVTTVLEVRLWKCPACGNDPGSRRITVCASCGTQLVSGFEAAVGGRG